jgi:hypothetical protein
MSEERFPRVFFPVPTRMARVLCPWFGNCRAWANWQRWGKVGDHVDTSGPRCAYRQGNKNAVFHCPRVAEKVKYRGIQELTAELGLEVRYLTEEEYAELKRYIPARYLGRFEEIWRYVDIEGRVRYRGIKPPPWLRKAWAKLQQARDERQRIVGTTGS